ncbi:class I adenylate-forming enzyme family protein [Oceanibacterium hippocampi]|uniref:3-methylmercaptopropionyl-CoA ligase n=1 Tax=Oceanibacterium hippocampi TaxID=745714 RepID=A0A1Y5TSA0_9PROT|nr:long-chain-fatty-acid--CoA ligase [Oceanibacterium hippocampi]SLN71030.1 Long-chain-fatty-acid--CoA ligase [Oceanibacterium hippocampi]
MNNLSYFLTRTAAANGSRPAIFHGETTHSYAWMDRQVSRLANGLVSLGLKPGDHVGLILANNPSGLVSLFAPLRAGMTIVPMNPKLHPQEHGYMLENSESRALIVSASLLDGLLAADPDLPDRLVVIAIDRPAGDDPRIVDFADLLARSADRFEDADVDADDIAWIFYTSGTTGKPKGAMLSHRNLTTMVNTQLIEFNPVKASDRLAYIAPLSHSNGLMAFQHVARAAGHVFPTFSRFTAGDFYRMVERYRVTTAFMVPTIIQIMLDDPSHKEHDLSSLHTVMYGGAPMYVDRLKEAVDTFGPIFVQGFAQGEAPMGCTCLPREEHLARDEVGERRLGSAGRECLFVKVRIFDNDGNQLPPGEAGEIVVRGDLVMRGYWKNPEANRAALQDGWLRTGDIGYLDEGGYLFLTDRKKDMIISGGHNIYPREIEEVLYRHPAIQEATVFGLPDRKWGERVVAAIVRKGAAELDEAGVVEWCRGNLASYKKPTEVHFFDELPKSGYGKILKREVRILVGG